LIFACLFNGNMAPKRIHQPPWVSYDLERLQDLDLEGIRTPAYVIDEAVLEKNLKILRDIRDATGCKILLAQKAFACYATYPLIGRYLDGVCAGGLHEAMLGKEYCDGEVHVFSPAYSEADFMHLLKISDCIVLNSLSQLDRFGERMKESRGVAFGLRVNPEYSEITIEKYNPTARFSRLGVRAGELERRDLSCISGLHFHALCEENSDTLERVLKAFETRFAKYIRLPHISWVNFGGGHHITRLDYDIARLCRLIDDFKKRYGIQVILEPGEAVALNAGGLVTSVLDIKHNEMDIAILDTSVTAHMPDVLEMPYRPVVAGADRAGKKPFTYRLAGATCLAGDVVGDYSFDTKLQVGSKLFFLDMVIYTMVKSTTFNGIKLPSMILYAKDGSLKLIKEFGYDDFKGRLS